MYKIKFQIRILDSYNFTMTFTERTFYHSFVLAIYVIYKYRIENVLNHQNTRYLLRLSENSIHKPSTGELAEIKPKQNAIKFVILY